MSAPMLDGNRGDTLVVAISHDQGLLKLTRSVSSELGLEVYTDEPRQGTLRRIARLRPSLVVLDVQLGHECVAWAILRALKECPATCRNPGARMCGRALVCSIRKQCSSETCVSKRGRNHTTQPNC
jgi:hypothetical protein